MRRWCSGAECGNRMRVAKFYARTRSDDCGIAAGQPRDIAPQYSTRRPNISPPRFIPYLPVSPAPAARPKQNHVSEIIWCTDPSKGYLASNLATASAVRLDERGPSGHHL